MSPQSWLMHVLSSGHSSLLSQPTCTGNIGWWTTGGLCVNGSWVLDVVTSAAGGGTVWEGPFIGIICLSSIGCCVITRGPGLVGDSCVAKAKQFLNGSPVVPGGHEHFGLSF